MISRDSDSSDWDSIWIDANLATMALHSDDPYGAIEDGVIALKQGRIAWVGSRESFPVGANDGVPVHSAQGRWITPGLIDCHTHIVYAGNRAQEFEMRLTGVSYEEIARHGGGIISTVSATREASDETLYDQGQTRLDRLMAEGVTTVEIKSGYGLDLDTEQKMLRVAKVLGRDNPIQVTTTFLGAHALPPEYQGQADAYIEFVCNTVLPKVTQERLADAVDGFCESIGFSVAQIERVFSTAQDLGLPVKLHAEQLSDLGGAALAARFGALSADHLEYASEESVRAMAASGTVAVLLPGAFYFLKESQKPPIEWFREYGIDVAVATDSNPGSSPVCSILLMLSMACTLFGMTPGEALAGITRNAARALGMSADIGTLEVGKAGDFVVWDVSHPAELAYHIGQNPCHQVIKDGVIVRRNQ